MRKLKLNHDELKVDSFSTIIGSGTGGTVIGRDTSPHPYTFGWNCQSYQETCYNRGCYGQLTTEGATDCPGQSNCGSHTQDGNRTCAHSCTEIEACTFCGAVC